MAQSREVDRSTSSMLTRLNDPDVRWLAGLSAVLLLALLPFSSYVVSLPLIEAEWQMNKTQAAMVFSSYLLGNAISALVLVPMTDRLTPQRVYLGGLVVLVISNLLFPALAGGFWAGAILRFVAGAGHIAAYVPGVQMVSRRFAGRKRGAAVGVFVSAGYAGTTLSYTFMGQLLSFTPSWQMAYFITALAGLVGLGLGYRLVGGEGLPLRQSGSLSAPRGRLNLRLLRDPAVALIIIAYTLHTAELYIARLWFPSLLGAALISPTTTPLEATTLAATWVGFMFMLGIAGVLTGGIISDYLGRTRGAAVIFVVSGLCSFAAGWLLNTPSIFIIGLGFVYGFATAADSAIYSTAVTELAPPDRIGATQALQSFIGFAVGAILPVVAGSILDATQSTVAWGLAFSFNGLLAVIGVICLLLLRRLPQAVEMAGGKK